MTESMQKTYTLANGVAIPVLGFGTYKTMDEKRDGAVLREAIRAGYRYFDTASFYGTEEALGEAIAESGIPREEFFIATKAWKSEMGYEQVKEAFAASLERLRLDYLDLYLIHWPLPVPDYEDWKELDAQTWAAMEELYQNGKVRAIGVSNFLPHHMKNLMERGRIAPMVDQLEFHPGYSQEAAVRYCEEHGIRVQAWSPLGRGRLSGEPLVKEMAQRYGVSIAQLCLRYAFQRGVIPIPKASSPERMAENQRIFDFAITGEDMDRLATMPQAGWSGEHPDRERAKRQ
ncbi:MAG: aldo/keto reductase [Eubacteriales bacterium]|nr:aldo/keto reductase [Eubacteriales bacterium]